MPILGRILFLLSGFSRLTERAQVPVFGLTLRRYFRVLLAGPRGYASPVSSTNSSPAVA